MTPHLSIQPRPETNGAWLAPAKLNLMLRIIGRRADGYHLLQTVFQFIDYSDQIWLNPRNDARIELLRGADQVPAERDLTVRAAHLLKQYTGCQRGVDITIDKRIPMGGGLGGGSSDAATTLHGLNQVWELGLDLDTLAQLGLQLGADVPVFVRGRAAWAEGIGEQLQPLTLPEPWYLVIKPDCEVATAAIFNAAELTRNSPPITMADFTRGDKRNDCTPVVRQRYPAVDQALQWLAARAEAQLTGTGSCIFATCDTEATARQLQSDVPKHWSSFVARGYNCSCNPLVTPLDERGL
ncbi:4-(cytidine 5'-diphospho)-2-C-methyl-D-erythritol kinase [Rhodoferax sp. 4810]|uniref:4-diphosphocytidyl-2-C-methyl-D-erythritol kinase n=1 Tax=Thiospirillum jenense TaxID=1653858 RepID=A0A839HC79_9GAMM|nr:4-(cytidine 5'-diphospho)-2-C-methyl-D-erythritol kinase [Thiospirillum jenense]MBB1073407.1 4-(cytidine 5'-diphospho)-2-C-methyl-D-erythritol kinase [Rhodoferax jenense]MBB1125760.1 4-(cytidine 5'-diphospho)-2-C-methyl-D-erythritol kinase [Thiospirillum jenense]